MKHQLSIFLLFLLICSCKKEEKAKDLYDYYDGQLTVKRNGKEWQPKLIALSDQKDSFWLIITDQKNGFIRDQIAYGKMQLRVANHFVEDGKTWDTSTALSIKAMIPVYYYSQSDIYKPMRLSNAYPRFVNIDNYDSVKGIVQGTFSMTFIIDPKFSTSGFQDTLNITEGFFSATIHHPDELPQ